MLKILSNKKGMTLMELIVGMMLFAIVAGTVSAILVPMLKAYTKANEIAEYNTLLDNIANQIIADLLQSTDDPLLNNTKPSIMITIDNYADVLYEIDDNIDSVNYGALLRNGTPVFTKKFYKSNSVSFVCELESGADKAYKLTVTISSDKDGSSISRDYAVRPLVLNQY